MVFKRPKELESANHDLTILGLRLKLHSALHYLLKSNSCLNEFYPGLLYVTRIRFSTQVFVEFSLIPKTRIKLYRVMVFRVKICTGQVPFREKAPDDITKPFFRNRF